MKNVKTILPDANKTSVQIDAFVLPNLYGGLDCDNCNYYIPKLFNTKYSQFAFDEEYMKGYGSYVREGYLNAFRSYIENNAGSDILNNPIINSGFTSAVLTIPNVKIGNISITKDIVVITKIEKSNLSELIYNILKFSASQGYSSIAIPFVIWPEYSQNEVLADIVQSLNEFFSQKQSDIQVYILVRKDLEVLVHALS